MNQQQLTERNIGDNLDHLMNLDPRGYGVCRILYPAARQMTGEPLTINAARQLLHTVQEDDLVYIFTGFVLLPHKVAEMDGIVSAVLLCRSLVKAFGCKPVIICPEDCLGAVRSLAAVIGLHLYESIDEVKQYPLSMGVICFTKDWEQAEAQAEEILSHGAPAAAVAVEAPGSNQLGKFHNSTGLDTTAIEAKSEVLFEKLQKMGVLNIAIGDLGNEMGLGAIGQQINTYIPYAAGGGCRCGCGGGIAVKTAAQHIITATVSNWGCYGMMAALAFLKEDVDVFHDAKLEEQALVAAARAGMIDMYGWAIPAVDGFSDKINCLIVELMRECIAYPARVKETCKTWFDKVIELGFYESGVEAK